MKKIQIKRRVGTLACIVALAFSSVAHATPYLLHQGGFSGGGEINLTFDGVDQNQDGLISSWDPGEVTQSFLTFSGNADVPDFASVLGPNELLLKFTVGKDTFETDASQGVYVTIIPDGSEPEGKSFNGYAGGNLGGGAFITVLLGRENVVSGEPRSLSPITISQVPEPGTLLSMALGLTALAVYGRRQFS
jgi:PEP-CTERM motif